MIRMKRNPRRGALLYGLAGMMMFFAVLCGLVLTRSMEVYRDARALQQRLQCIAGAESMGRVLARDSEAKELVMGSNTVTVLSSENGAVRLRSAILLPNGKEALSLPFIARFTTAPDGTTTFEGVFQP